MLIWELIKIIIFDTNSCCKNLRKYFIVRLIINIFGEKIGFLALYSRKLYTCLVIKINCPVVWYLKPGMPL